MTIPSGFKPMKGEAAKIEDIQFPCYASPKLDGVRCIVFGGVAYSADLRPHGNAFIQAWAKENAEALEGLDGELCVGPPNDPDVFKHTSGAVRRVEGEPDFNFWVFDVYEPDHMFIDRSAWLGDRGTEYIDRVRLVPLEYQYNRGGLEVTVSRNVRQGYEGTMVRQGGSPYKCGRSTVKEGGLLKLKSFIDHEAEIIGVVEEMKNTNTATKGNRGQTKRSSAKAGKVGKGTLGKFLCRGLNGPFKGVEFSVGTGTLTKPQKQALWRHYLSMDRQFATLHCASDEPASCDHCSRLIGQTLTYTHMEHSGGYTKPRHAGFLRFRPREDIDCSS